jgi:hypothetical protein
LYTISRSDLSPAQSAVQAAHAALEHAYLYGRPPDHHPSYIHITVHNKLELVHLCAQLKGAGHQVAEFYEPYRNWGLTAVAVLLNEDCRHVLKEYKLWSPVK